MDKSLSLEKPKRLDMTIVVGVCIKNDINEILMVQEAKEGVKGLYNIPAGRLDSKESICEGAVREAKEETGFDVKLDSILCIQHLEYQNILKIIFNASIISGSIKFNKNEIMDVKWISIDKLEKMTEKELRSYKSVVSIIRDSKNNVEYPINIIEIK